MPLPQTTSSTQAPLVHVEPLAQLPQLPPQPSEPQVLPLQLLVQHAPATQVPVPQVQSEQLVQVSPAVLSQVPLPQVDDVTQLPPWQMLPEAHCEHTPPQPSSPHFPGGQLGVQHCPETQLPPGQAQSSVQLSQSSVASHVPLPQETCPMHLPSAHSSPVGQPLQLSA